MGPEPTYLKGTEFTRPSPICTCQVTMFIFGNHPKLVNVPSFLWTPGLQLTVVSSQTQALPRRRHGAVHTRRVPGQTPPRDPTRGSQGRDATSIPVSRHGRRVGGALQ